MKTMLVTALLLLSTLSLGQAPISNAQRQDCSNAKEAIKKNGTNPNVPLKDLRALLANLQQACGTPDNSQPTPDIRKAVADCSIALTAFDKNITAPNLPTDDFNALFTAVQRDCRTRLSAHDTEAARDSQPAADVHRLVVQSITALNREIALGNRLIAHLQKAQTWEGVDADHPDAVALRAKIADEEKDLDAATQASSDLTDKIDPKRAQKECDKDELDSWIGLLTEATGVLKDVRTQKDRYHALGY